LALITIGPTKVDEAIARRVARGARSGVQRSLRAITFVADENVLLGASAGLWVISRFGSPDDQDKVNHLVLTVVASTILPHLLKRIVDQQRPDRRVHGPRNGIPKSGKSYDAFPSGHALHMGAVASAVSRRFPRWRFLAWGFAAALGTTRVLLLAHWLSDVVAGLAMGQVLEDCLAAVSRRRQR
jgi:membrane-associated phospholipid phosphatase